MDTPKSSSTSLRLVAPMSTYRFSMQSSREALSLSFMKCTGFDMMMPLIFLPALVFMMTVWAGRLVR